MSARRTRGFTLLEVLIALALVAIVLGGTFASLRATVTTQARLEQRVLAQWVADNALARALLDIDAEPPDPPTETLLGHSFRYEVSITRRPAPSPAAGHDAQADDAEDDDGEDAADTTEAEVAPGADEAGLGTEDDAETRTLIDILVEVRAGNGRGATLARAARTVVDESAS